MLVVKNLTAKAGDVRDTGSLPGSGRPLGGGHGNPLQCSCLKQPMDRGAWRAVVHGVAVGHDEATWQPQDEWPSGLETRDISTVCSDHTAALRPAPPQVSDSPTELLPILSSRHSPWKRQVVCSGCPEGSSQHLSPWLSPVLSEILGQIHGFPKVNCLTCLRNFRLF